METIADDLVWLCRELELKKPVIVGHSMGGNVALELAARYPEIPDSILMIDSVLFSNPEFRKFLRDVMEGLLTSDYVVACQNALHATCLPSDEEPMKEEVLGLTTPNVKNRTLRFWGSMVPSKRMA